MKEFTQAGRPGAYLRILEEGQVAAGDVIEVVHRPEHDVTLGLAFAAKTAQGVDRSALLPALTDLSPKWQEWAAAGER